MKCKQLKRYAICALVVFFLIKWYQSIFFYIFYHPKTIERVPGTKYVLQLSSPFAQPFAYMGRGHDTFIKRSCAKNNCYITSDRSLFNNITVFDAVLFHGPEINKEFRWQRLKRSANQLYIFVSAESSAYYPMADELYNRFFNVTWTYKLNSDIYFGYMIIRNKSGEVIGPKADIPWMDINDMQPIGDDTKKKLARKRIAAAWFVSNCDTLNSRSELAQQIKKELEDYNMVVDIYGTCGDKKCPRDSMEECLRLIQRDYYFYFAFENSMSYDYVTEKLMHALKNYAVPVVFGGADYKRFMPDGIYLNALESSVEDLVSKMVSIITDKDGYHNFFKWHNHYSYHDPEETPDTDPYCHFCEYINKAENKKKPAVENFYEWWNVQPKSYRVPKARHIN